QMNDHREHRHAAQRKRDCSPGLNRVEIENRMKDARDHEHDAVDFEGSNRETRRNVNPGENQEYWDVLEVVAPCPRRSLNRLNFLALLGAERPRIFGIDKQSP